MYKHILVPTDGSQLSMKAVRTAAALAKAVGAHLTGLSVMPSSSGFYTEGTAEGHAIVEKHLREAHEKEAKKSLAAVEIEAKTAGVPYDGMIAESEDAWKEVIHAATSKKCDLIVMGSHGRKGLEGLILGSVTVKVLTHTKIPVLVCR